MNLRIRRDHLTRHPGTIAGSLLCAATLALMLSGCGTGTTSTEKGVYSAAIALTAADQIALQYIVLPLCGPTHAKPACSEAAVSAKIKSAAQDAHDAVKAAEKSVKDGATDSPAYLAAANAAIAALVALTPKT